MRVRLLRMLLVFAGIAWSVSIVGVFASWSQAEEMLKGFGAKTISYDPMLDYWLRMTAGAFTMIGCLFFVAAIWVQRFRDLIPWLGGLMTVEGLILLGHGIRLDLPPLPFYGDVAACLGGGGAILFLAATTRKR